MNGRLRYWAELTAGDVAAFDPDKTITVLPLGATEQHGPHLPLGTDSLIAESVLTATAEKLNSDANLVVLPTQPVGLSVEHEGFAGTLSGEAATLLAFWQEIAACVARARVRKIVLFNSHGGQSALLSIIAQELRRKHGLSAATYHCYRVWRESPLFDVDERRHGIHGGAIETSIIMAVRPDLVRRDRLADFSSEAAMVETNTPALVPGGKLSVAWQMSDLNVAGAAGNATAARAEAGYELIDSAATDFARFLDDFSMLDPDFTATRDG